MKRMLTVLLVVFMGLFFAGCAKTLHSITVKKEIGSQEIISSDYKDVKTVSIDVITDKEWTEEANTLKTVLEEQIKSFFPKWNNTTNGDAKISVKIFEVKRVGGFARFLVGILAGRASISADVELKIDKKTEKYHIDAKAAESSPFASLAGLKSAALGNTALAIDEMAAVIMSILTGKNSDEIWQKIQEERIARRELEERPSYMIYDAAP
ncbi:MAG: hypothetical protein QMD86_02055 [Patescibacteria group bacterium]|nr:hypothetical protein [Patescibacteria group bacterium]